MSSITDIQGIKVGHASDFDSITGCTVLIFDQPVNGAADLRGGGTSTRQIDSLLSHNTFGKINAILLTGGSAFGLNASAGVMRYLEENGIGLDVGYNLVVPSVPTAVIFDLGIGNGRVRPDAEMGYEACVNTRTSNIEEGSVGVGTGATIGKLLGSEYATKGGIATLSIKLNSGVTIGVLVVVNAFGDVIDPSNGGVIAGVRDETQKEIFPGTVNMMKKGITRKPLNSGNTTLAVVATDAEFSKSELLRISNIAQTGLARVISPVHTVSDGDLVISVSCGEGKEDTNTVGVVAAELIEKAIIKAVGVAKSLGGVPSASELGTI